MKKQWFHWPPEVTNWVRNISLKIFRHKTDWTFRRRSFFLFVLQDLVLQSVAQVRDDNSGLVYTLCLYPCLMQAIAEGLCLQEIWLRRYASANSMKIFFQCRLLIDFFWWFPSSNLPRCERKMLFRHSDCRIAGRFVMYMWIFSLNAQELVLLRSCIHTLCPFCCFLVERWLSYTVSVAHDCPLD